MPWKECSVMDERLRFVAKLLDGESMTDVCREFGISRKTNHQRTTHLVHIKRRQGTTNTRTRVVDHDIWRSEVLI